MDISYAAPEQAFDLAQYIIMTIGAFAALATATPNKSDDAIMQRILTIVNVLGGNFGKAANPKDETPSDSSSASPPTNG